MATPLTSVVRLMCCLALCLLASCGGDPPSTAKAPSPAAKPMAADLPLPTDGKAEPKNNAVTEVAHQPDAETNSDGHAAEDREADVTDQPQPAFEPPFGDRVHLFAPPERDELPESVEPELRDESDVQLKGFVNVGEPRALLMIGGEMAPLAAGDSTAGVKVISISPPEVVLERGRQRWKVSLSKSTRD